MSLKKTISGKTYESLKDFMDNVCKIDSKKFKSEYAQGERYTARNHDRLFFRTKKEAKNFYLSVD